MTDFAALAQAARPINDDDWGSERQIKAFNAFCAAVEAELPRKIFHEWEDWSIKATTDEIIDEALRLLGLKEIE